ncbi:MAG: hypothetical protein V1735_00035 [Nanoarchaeota archaeon]
MERWDLLNGLFDSKKIGLLQCFFREPDKRWYLLELAKTASLPPATVLRSLQLFLKLEIITLEVAGPAKLYKAALTENYRFLEAFLQQERQLLAEFVKVAATIFGVDSILLHGKASKQRANILLIGDSIDPQAVKELCSNFFERHKFTISSLTLTREQFEQMTSMGLYSGEKRLLWAKP